MSVLFADDALLLYFTYHAFQSKCITETHRFKLTYGSTPMTSDSAIGHNLEPLPSICHLNNPSLHHTTDALVAEPKVSTSSMPKPANGHNPEPVPSVISTNYASDIPLTLR
jgi:hypothetical protein